MIVQVISLPSYKRKRIGALKSLGAALGISINDMLKLSDEADELYRVAQNLSKSDGSIRIVYDALPPLKRVHKKIKMETLNYVEFPTFLTGSIKGRDYKVNAALHAGA